MLRWPFCLARNLIQYPISPQRLRPEFQLRYTLAKVYFENLPLHKIHHLSTFKFNNEQQLTYGGAPQKSLRPTN